MEPEKIDLSSLDPGAARIHRMTARVLELHRLRRVVVRNSALAVLLAAAAALAFWWSRPTRTTPSSDVLSWAIRDADPSELLRLGGHDAY